MAGFAVLYQPDSKAQDRERDFQRLLRNTAEFKDLDMPTTSVAGRSCTAAKLDGRPSLHRGVVHDGDSGSWLLAAGTVVALTGDNNPNILLANLLRCFIDDGIEALQHYDGQFALAIYNARDDTLSVISDPMGCFAIYYARQGQKIFISTSALAIARLICSKPDDLTIECFLRTEHPYGEKTLWQDVKRVRPATILKISCNHIEESEYWTPVLDETIARLSLDEALELAEEKISRTFRNALQREGKVWADLTGGFDTRVVTMFMAQLGIPFFAYCVGSENHPDVQISSLICQEMGWEYRHMTLPEEWDQGQYAWFETALHKGDAHLNAFQLAGVLRGHQERSLFFPVHISGSGADEWRYHIYGAKILFHNSQSKVNYDEILASRILSPLPVNIMRQDRTAEARSELIRHFMRIEAKYAGYDVLTRTDIIFLRHRHPIHGGAYLSSETGIMRGLIPFCFKELENFGFSLNNLWRIRYHASFVRNLVERGDPRLAKIRTAKGEPAGPIRPNNIFQFMLLWEMLAKKAVDKVSKKLLRRSSETQYHPSPIGHTIPSMRAAWLNWVLSEGLLEASKMHSGKLYNQHELKKIIFQTLSGSVENSVFMDHVITLEMALRAVGAAVD